MRSVICKTLQEIEVSSPVSIHVFASISKGMVFIAERIVNRGISNDSIDVINQCLYVVRRCRMFVPKNYFHPILTDELQLSLLAKCFKLAADMIDSHPILYVSTENSQIEQMQKDSLDLLRYFYMAGLVFIGLKRYSDALFMLEQCFSLPSTDVSAVMVEAYKKYVLITLITSSTGKFNETRSIPRYASSSVSKSLPSQASIYLELASIVGEISSLTSASQTPTGMEKLTSFITKNLDTFNRDQNYGLVKQSINALHRRKIKQLSSAYINISLQDASLFAGIRSVAECQRIVERMIESDELQAKIDQRSMILRFIDDDDEGSTHAKKSSDTIKWFEKIESLVTISNLASNANDTMLTSSDFISSLAEKEMRMKHPRSPRNLII